MRRVLVFRNGSIGNTLVLVPVLRALRARYPDLAMDVVVDRVADAVLEDCPYVDGRIRYERHEKGRFLPRHAALIRRLRAGGYDAAVVAKRFFRNEVLAFLSGAPVRVGFRTGPRAPRLLTAAVPYREDRNIVDLNLGLLEPLGVPLAGKQLEFWWRPGDEGRAAGLWEEHGLKSGPVVIMHPGGTTQASRLVPLEVFLDTARRLRARGARAVFVFGAGETGPHARVAAAGETALLGERLGAVACAMKRSALFLGHDSGPSHLAHAVGLPGLIVYADDPGWERHLAKWKPEGDRYRALPRSRVDADYLDAAVRDALDSRA